MNLKEFVKNRQQLLTLTVGYVLMAGIAFSLGRISASTHMPPEIRVEEAFAPLNNTAETQANQLGTDNNSNGPAPATQTGKNDCFPGQIKGNISGSNKVYHMPGGSFYNRTMAEQCFSTEAEAIAAGFRKSKN